MTPTEIEDLKRLLGRMRREDPDFRVFGSAQHQYRLGPTLTEAGLSAFEAKHGVRLPGDYRAFLSEAGNGGLGPDSPRFMGRSGAGPCYGLLALEDAASDSSLGRPFPFTEATEGMPDGEVEAAIDPDGFPGMPGALALCHGGSGIVYFLIVHGPAYGAVWVGREEFFPVAPSFDAWYGDWARGLEERALPRLTEERKVAAARVGMTRAEVIALCGGEWEQRRWTGGKSHLKFEHLSTEFEIEDDVVVRVIAHSIY